jgi:hypothetical protein
VDVDEGESVAAVPTQSEQRPEHDAAVTAEHQREPPAGESGLDTISDAHCEHGDPFRVEHVRVGVTRRAIRPTWRLDHSLGGGLAAHGPASCH